MIGSKTGIYAQSGGGAAYNPITTAWASAGSVVGTTELDAVNAFTEGLKADGLIASDYLSSSFHYHNIVSATSLSASLNDLFLNFNSTAFNSPSYSANEIKGNGVDSYLSASFVPSTDGASLNNYGFFIRVRTPQSRSRTLMGSRGGGGTNPYNAIHYERGNRYTGCNSGLTGQSTTNWPAATIHIIRVNSTEYKIYIDGVLDSTIAEVSNNVSTELMFILCQNWAANSGANVFSDAGIVAYGECEGLTPTQVANHHARLVTLDANIISGGR